MQSKPPNVKPSIGEKVNDFVQKNRKPIFISAAAIALLLIISIAALALMDRSRNRAIGLVEDFHSRHEALRPIIHEDFASGDVAELIADIEPFARRTSGYAGAKAWSIIASIHSERNEWPEAETAWANAAAKSARFYLAPVAWFNAAVAAEEQGKTEQAIEYYTRSLSTQIGFPSAARAQFSIGRLRETLNERDEAMAAYRAVISGWPHDTVWLNLARSRIIALHLPQEEQEEQELGY